MPWIDSNSRLIVWPAFQCHTFRISVSRTTSRIRNWKNIQWIPMENSYELPIGEIHLPSICFTGFGVPLFLAPHSFGLHYTLHEQYTKSESLWFHKSFAMHNDRQCLMLLKRHRGRANRRSHWTFLSRAERPSRPSRLSVNESTYPRPKSKDLFSLP